MLFLIKRRHIKGEKYITPMNFAEHFRKAEVTKNSKVYYGQFQRNELHEGSAITVQLLKVDEMYNILKFASHCLLVKRWRWNWMINVFAGAYSWMSIRLLRASFIKGQALYCKRYSSSYYAPPLLRDRLYIVRDIAPEI